MLKSAAQPATDGRSTRWDAHKSARRSALLDAALAAIEADGPGVGVQQIARRAGVPRSVVYRHFADRADLDAQINQHIVGQAYAELMPTLEPHGTVNETIRRVIGTYLGWIERHPQLHAFVVAHSAAPSGGAGVIAETKAAVAGIAGELLASAARTVGKKAGLAPSIAVGLVGFVDATVNHWLANGRTVSAAQLTELITQSIWSVLDGNARAIGVEIDPDRPVLELLGG